MIADTLARSEYGTELTEIMFSYVGSSSCTWSTSPQLVPALRDVMDSVRNAATRYGAFATFVGIDIDPQANAIDAHLRTFGQFDQIAAGGSFMNIATMEKHGGVTAAAEGTPQLIVRERILRKGNARGDPLVVEVISTRVLARYFGLQEILGWAEQGAPLPVPRVASAVR